MPEFNDWYTSSLYGRDVINVKGFGALGNGALNTMTDLGYANLAAAQVDYPLARSMDDSADWCGIQAAIDHALNPTNAAGGPSFATGIILVYIPNGVYLTTDTIHLGYGMITGTGNFCCVQLEGAGWAIIAGEPTGTVIVAQFVDRPVINIQGGRESGVRKLAIRGGTTVPDLAMAGPNFKADAANLCRPERP